jgi:hypothetical protein
MCASPYPFLCLTTLLRYPLTSPLPNILHLNIVLVYHNHIRLSCRLLLTVLWWHALVLGVWWRRLRVMLLLLLLLLLMVIRCAI